MLFSNYTKLLVPVDESKQSEISFKKAVAIAQRNHAKIYLLHVMDGRNFSISSENSAVKDPEIDQTFLKEKEKIAHEADITIETFIYGGNPKTIIADSFPKTKGIDLIIISATGRGAIDRALVGSVSSYVMKHANCDVLVVR